MIFKITFVKTCPIFELSVGALSVGPPDCVSDQCQWVVQKHCLICNLCVGSCWKWYSIGERLICVLEVVSYLGKTSLYTRSGISLGKDQFVSGSGKSLGKVQSVCWGYYITEKRLMPGLEVGSCC